MPTLDAKTIAGIAVNAGFKGKAVETAVAVALGESSGRTDARGDVAIQTAEWGPSIGLWQIRSRKAESGKGSSRDATRLMDPGFNAKAAYQISSSGTNFRPWSVYTSGAYLMHLPQAKAGVKANGGRAIATGTAGGPTDNPLIPDALEGPLDAAAATAQAIKDLAGFPARVLAWISDRNNIIRVAKVGTGLGLVIMGLSVVARPVVTGALGVAGKAVGLVGPGKVAKVAGAGKAAGAAGAAKSAVKTAA